MSDIRDVPPKTGILMGTAFTAAGLMIVFIALDWIHVDPSSIHAPRWVLAVCGGIFALPGIGMLYYAFVNLAGGGGRAGAGRAGRGARDGPPVLLKLIGLTVTVGMAAVFGWVAFGSGERHFSGGIGLGPIHLGGSSSGAGGRVVFGIGAVLIGALAVWGVIAWLRTAVGGGRDG